MSDARKLLRNLAETLLRDLDDPQADIETLIERARQTAALAVGQKIVNKIVN